MKIHTVHIFRRMNNIRHESNILGKVRKVEKLPQQDSADRLSQFNRPIYWTLIIDNISSFIPNCSYNALISMTKR